MLTSVIVMNSNHITSLHIRSVPVLVPNEPVVDRDVTCVPLTYNRNVFDDQVSAMCDHCVVESALVADVARFDVVKTLAVGVPVEPRE